MKKLLPIIIILILAFLLAACGNQAANETAGNAAASSEEATAEQIKAALLSGYPQDVLPLYHPEALSSCSFSYRPADQYDIGKDIYSVTYQSSASQQDLTNYYSGLFSEKDETLSVEGDEVTDKLSGKIGANNVEILFLDNGDSTTKVYLTLGLSSDQYVNENPYFTDSPQILADAYGLTELQEATYEEQYYSEKTDHYITVYLTNVTLQEFSDYYNQKYASMTGYAQSGSDPGASFSWQDQGFDVDIYYSGGNTSYITMDISKAG